MRTKFSVLLLAAALFWGCIDGDYDLSKVNTDNIVIGDEIEIPIATITLDSYDIDGTERPVYVRSSSSEGLSFLDMMSLINALLPSSTTVDLELLVNETVEDNLFVMYLQFTICQ